MNGYNNLKQMKLVKGEFTTKGFLDLLKKKFVNKINGKQFTSNDVAQYLIRGYTPHRYGNLHLSSTIEEGVRIITVKEEQ